MPDQFELDFWDRLVLQPDARPAANTGDERLVLAVDALLPDPFAPAARERARQRVFHASRMPVVPVPLPPRSIANASVDIRSGRPVQQTARHGALVAAALLVLLGAIGIWAEAGLWPNRTSQTDSRFIPAVSDATDDVVMRGVDPGRTNVVPGAKLESAPEFGWEYKVEDVIIPAPLVVDEVVYIGESSDSPQDPGAILAIRASDGLLLWSFPTEHGLSATFVYDRGALYAVDDNGVIYAVDAQSGAERWRSALRGDLPYQFTYYSDLLLVGGRLVFTTGSILAAAASDTAIFVANPAQAWIEGDRHVYAVSPQDGSILWDAPGHPNQETGGVSALSLDDGSLIWNHSDSPAFGGPAYAGGLVYFGVHEPATIVAVDAATGTERWRAVVSDTGKWDSWTSFAVTGHEFIAGTPSGELISLDRRTGEPTSLTPIFAGKSSTYMSSGIVVAGNVAIATNIGWMEAIDLTDRTMLWQFAVDANQWILPVVSGGRIFQIAFDESDDNSTLVMLEIPADSS